MPSRSANGENRPSPPVKRGARRRSQQPSSRTESSDRVAVGRILRPHGVRGELKVEVWSDVEGRFDAGNELYLNVHGRIRRIRIEQARPERGNILLRISGIDDRDQAEEVRNARFEVDASEVPEPPEGFYYHYQLVGCACHEEETGELGTVVEVVEDGGGFLLRVEKDDRSVLVPFVDAFLTNVDVVARRIDLRLPDGLVAVCTSKS